MSQLSNTFDVIIVGAGASGLWLANDLKNAGYSIALLCDGKIGNGQTICSQGIIHTGIKYVFSDILDDFFYSLHPVCQRWDEHFKNKLRPYLSSTNIESHKTTIWSDIEIEDTLSSVFGIQNIINKIKYQKKENGFHQYQIEEKTIDINTLIYALSKDIFENIIFYDSKSILFKSDSIGDVSDLSIKTTDGRHLDISTKFIIFASGTENKNLIKTSLNLEMICNDSVLSMKYIYGNLPKINGHIYENKKLMLSITSPHSNHNDYNLWVIGGGVAENADDNYETTDKILSITKKLFSVTKKDIISVGHYASTRSEPSKLYGRRFTEPFIYSNKNIFAVWPIKLTLVPRLSSNMISLLQKRIIKKSGDTKIAMQNKTEILQSCAIQPWLTSSSNI